MSGTEAKTAGVANTTSASDVADAASTAQSSVHQEGTKIVDAAMENDLVKKGVDASSVHSHNPTYAQKNGNTGAAKWIEDSVNSGAATAESALDDVEKFLGVKKWIYENKRMPTHSTIFKKLCMFHLSCFCSLSSARGALTVRRGCDVTLRTYTKPCNCKLTANNLEWFIHSPP